MANDNSVRTKHREVLYHFEKWKKVRNAVTGNLTSYLRNVGLNERDKSYGEARQYEYERGAICYNFTKRTLSGMVGSVMRKDPEQIIPEELEYLLRNCDGSGVGLWQHAQDTLMEIDSIGEKVYSPLTKFYTENRNVIRQNLNSVFPSYLEKILYKSLLKMKEVSESKTIDYVLIKCRKVSSSNTS